MEENIVSISVSYTITEVNLMYKEEVNDKFDGFYLTSFHLYIGEFHCLSIKWRNQVVIKKEKRRRKLRKIFAKYMSD